MNLFSFTSPDLKKLTFSMSDLSAYLTHFQNLYVKDGAQSKQLILDGLKLVAAIRGGDRVHALIDAVEKDLPIAVQLFTDVITEFGGNNAN